MSRIGLLGGSFDPPHQGHRLLAVWALSTGEIDELLLAPCFSHAFGKEGAPFEHRLAMTRLLGQEIGSQAHVSDLEASLGVPSRTFRTLSALRDSHPDDTFRLVIGEDILSEATQWHRWDDVCAMAPPLVAGRQGSPPTGHIPSISLPAISSTEVRSRLGSGQDIGTIVPAPIVDYLHQHNLYLRSP